MVRGDPLTILVRLSTRLPDGTKARQDLTGREFRAQVRQSPDKELLGTFTVTVLTQAGDTLGALTMALPGAVTAVLPTSVVWDLEEISGGQSVATHWIVDYCKVQEDVSYG